MSWIGLCVIFPVIWEQIFPGFKLMLFILNAREVREVGLQGRGVVLSCADQNSWEKQLSFKRVSPSLGQTWVSLSSHTWSVAATIAAPTVGITLMVGTTVARTLFLTTRHHIWRGLALEAIALSSSPDPDALICHTHSQKRCHMLLIYKLKSLGNSGCS